MRRSVILSAAVALSALSNPAIASDRGFYLGFDIGQGSVDSDQRALDRSLVNAFAQLGVAVLSGSSEVSEDALTYGVILGYQFLPYLALEASYIDMGEFEYKARGTLSDGGGTAPGNFSISASGKAPTLSALGILPFADTWSVFGRLGVAFADVDYDVRLTVADQRASLSESDSSQNFLWGAGVGYTAGPWTSRVEYQQIQDLGSDSVTGKGDGSRIVFAAIYKF